MGLLADGGGSEKQALQEKIRLLHDDINRRYALLAGARLTYLEQLKFEETGRLPPHLAKEWDALRADYRMLESLMAKLRRLAGGQELRRY